MKSIHRAMAAAVALVLALGLTLATGGGATAATNVPGSTIDTANKQQILDVFKGINAFRASKGLKAVKFNVAVSEMAEDWSDTMARSTFRHNPAYATDPRVAGRWSRTGEIIAARGDTKGQGLVSQWIGSPGHNAIMSDPAYTHIGIGIAKNRGQYAMYGTVNFFTFKAGMVPAGTYASPSSFFPSAPTPAASAALPTDRISGTDRYATALALSKSGYPATAKVVYLATGANFPDALVAAPAAAKEGGPLLLSRAGALPSGVKAEIGRLKPSKVVVVGSRSVVSDQVLAEVRRIVPNTVRRGGTDRYATARAIVAGAYGASATAYVATGTNYPDALSAAASAGASDSPVLLVPGTLASVDRPTLDLLRTLGVKRTVLAGSASVLSTGIERGLAAHGPVRQAGPDRFATSQALNKDLAGTASRAYLATGFNYPDALAGAAVAGAKGAPLYLVRPGCVPRGTLKDINDSPATRVTLLGSEAVLGKNLNNLASCAS